MNADLNATDSELTTATLRTPAFWAVAAASSLLMTAVAVAALVIVRGRERFVPPAECYTTLLGSTAVCRDHLVLVEWALWPVAVGFACATLAQATQSVRLYFLNHRRRSS